jgi:hypothetical protein
MRFKCANVRIRRRQVIGDCHSPGRWFCPHCDAIRCPSQAPRGICDACGSSCDDLPTECYCLNGYEGPGPQSMRLVPTTLVH